MNTAETMRLRRAIDNYLGWVEKGLSEYGKVSPENDQLLLEESVNAQRDMDELWGAFMKSGKLDKHEKHKFLKLILGERETVKERDIIDIEPVQREDSEEVPELRPEAKPAAVELTEMSKPQAEQDNLL